MIMSSIPLVIVIPLLAGAVIIGYAIAHRRDLMQFSNKKPIASTPEDRDGSIQSGSKMLQRIAEQPQRTSEISREILHAASVTEGLQYLVQLIHNRLGYHHVYAYQVEETQQDLSLKSAAGATAAAILRSGHHIPMGGKTLVAQAAKQGQPMLTKASSKENEPADPFESSLLPGAQVAVALPLSIDDQLLAVLNIQSNSPDALSDQDVGPLTILADQCAAALKVLSLKEEKEILQAEVEALQRQFHQDKDSIHRYDSQFHVKSPASYTYTNKEGVIVTDVTSISAAEINHILDNGQVKTKMDDQELGTSLTVPVNLGDRVIGALRLCHQDDKSWQSEDIETLRSVIRQLAPAIENARLLEETERRAALEQSTSQIAATMRETLDIETILRTAAQEIRHTLQLPEVVIRLGPPPDQGPESTHTGAGKASSSWAKDDTPDRDPMQRSSEEVLA
jgi:GAF domain-containing protein